MNETIVVPLDPQKSSFCSPHFGFKKPERKDTSGVTRLGRPQYLLATNLGCPSWEAWMEHLCTDEDIPLPECWRDLRRNPPPLAPEIIHGILRKGHKAIADFRLWNAD